MADKSPNILGPNTATAHGFTQHEHLDGLGLIHMNGRVYDYALGRFLGVDPFIQFPSNSQSLNPYSYILNNPLAGTDPTGYAACGDISSGDPGSGTCDFTQNGVTTEVNFSVGSNGTVAVAGKGVSTSVLSGLVSTGVLRPDSGASAGTGARGDSNTGKSTSDIGAVRTSGNTSGFRSSAARFGRGLIDRADRALEENVGIAASSIFRAAFADDANEALNAFESGDNSGVAFAVTPLVFKQLKAVKELGELAQDASSLLRKSTNGIIKASETIGRPVEAVIGNRKVRLRVDIEPNGKLQIQAGSGKASIIDFRPDLSKPLGPQIDKAFKRIPESAREALKKNAEEGLRKLRETGNL